ncbi:response regulator transcription factor [Methylobacterium durans]|uniref:helix-turn-helix domain-containing protein n=1 Tax=Methylobacterium durans TaxID=2202825 RepID=UPI002AFF5C6F|nr:response regulator transcription factor [Methylobacterium durans]MEA1831569.1 response regulator transcription factor [Methylobacterium durans]
MPKSSGRATYLQAVERVMNGDIFVPSAIEGGPHPAQGIESAALRIGSLTPAQMNVLTLSKRGLINKQIAFELGIGDSMVKAHISEIMRKLGVRNRTQVALCAASLDFDRTLARRE